MELGIGLVLGLAGYAVLLWIVSRFFRNATAGYRGHAE